MKKGKGKKICIAIVALLIIIPALYLFLVKPGKNRSEDMAFYEQYRFAHRGFYDNSTDAPENSLRAFDKAVANGYAIELDVQTTTDGRVVVFHDGNLSRMCGPDKNLYDCSYDELTQYKLADSDEGIPLFSDVLELVNGQVPILVEIKSDGDWKKTTELTAELLDKYQGPYMVQSFHPGVVGWFRKNRPDVIRGQLATDMFDEDIEMPAVTRFLLTNMLLNFLSRPNFIAYKFDESDRLSCIVCRDLFKSEQFAWTIRSENDLETSRKNFNGFIFEGFAPEK